MPYTLKPNKLFAKDPNGDGYLPQNVVTDQSTAEQVALINSTGAAQVSAIQAKGAETLDSIPDDYTALQGEVDGLKSAITEQTQNLVVGVIKNCSIESNGAIHITGNAYDVYYAPVENGKTYTIKTNDTANLVCGFYNSIPKSGDVATSGRIVQASKTISSTVDGYIAFRTMHDYEYAQVVEGTEDVDYIRPLTAVDVIARKNAEVAEQLANDALTANEKAIKEIKVISQLSVLTDLLEPGVYNLSRTYTANVTDAPSDADTNVNATLIVIPNNFTGNFTVQKYQQLTSDNKIKEWTRIIITQTGVVFKDWYRSDIESLNTLFYKPSTVTGTVLADYVEPGTYGIDSGVFDNLTDKPSDATHHIYYLTVIPKVWAGSFTTQRLERYTGEVWERSINTTTKAILRDWHRIDPQYYIAQAGGNVLYGKKLVTAGDSYTAADFSGDYAAYNKKNFGYYIAQRNGMTFVNSGISGSTMAVSNSSVPTDKSPFSYQRYLDVPSDTDYLTIWFGINDSAYSTLGTIDDTENTTFYGAWNTVLRYYLTNRPFMKILIIVTTIGVGTEENQAAFQQAIRDVAEKWGYPYLDLVADKTIPAFFQRNGMSNDALLLRRDAFGWNGPVRSHPNPQLHEYESTIIEAKLRSI